MKIADPGHFYLLDHLDGQGQTLLRFVKRVGPNYPGNNGAYEGTTSQEVIRALIDRTKYVSNQQYWEQNDNVLFHLRNVLYELEERAAKARNEFDHFRAMVKSAMILDHVGIEDVPTCPECHHIYCLRHREQ